MGEAGRARASAWRSRRCGGSRWPRSDRRRTGAVRTDGGGALPGPEDDRQTDRQTCAGRPGLWSLWENPSPMVTCPVLPPPPRGAHRKGVSTLGPEAGRTSPPTPGSACSSVSTDRLWGVASGLWVPRVKQSHRWPELCVPRWMDLVPRWRPGRSAGDKDGAGSGSPAASAPAAACQWVLRSSWEEVASQRPPPPGHPPCAPHGLLCAQAPGGLPTLTPRVQRPPRSVNRNCRSHLLCPGNERDPHTVLWRVRSDALAGGHVRGRTDPRTKGAAPTSVGPAAGRAANLGLSSDSGELGGGQWGAGPDLLLTTGGWLGGRGPGAGRAAHGRSRARWVSWCPRPQ